MIPNLVLVPEGFAMKNLFGVLILAVAVFPVFAADGPIPWAYAIPARAAGGGYATRNSGPCPIPA